MSQTDEKQFLEDVAAVMRAALDERLAPILERLAKLEREGQQR